MTDNYAAYEEKRAVQLLESLGYIVRRPEQASFPVAARVFDNEGGDPFRRVTVRVDTEINGRRCAVAQQFAALEIEGDRGQCLRLALPKIMTRELSRFMAGSLSQPIEDALAPKLAAIGGENAGA